MPAKEQAQTTGKAKPERRPPWLEAQPLETVDWLHLPETTVQRAAQAPHSLTPQDVSRLQRAYGNRAVLQLPGVGGSADPVQRQVPEEEEEPLQAKAVQRQVPEEEEEPLQAMPDVGRVGLAGGPVPPEVETAITRARGGGRPLDGAVQAQMGETMGYDFGGVRVHTDAGADKLNKQLQAKAFTTGSDIFFQRGAYDPGSGGGRELIAHELSHVVQQGTGRVSGGGGGMTIRPAGDPFEAAADVQARQVALQRAEAKPPLPIPAGCFAQPPGPALPPLAATLSPRRESMSGQIPNKSPQSPTLLSQGHGGSNDPGTVVQRMVAVAQDDMTSVTDLLVFNNLDYAKNKFGEPVGDFKSHKVFHELKENETLAIVEHGAVGKIGGGVVPTWDAGELTTRLTTGGNTLPKHARNIVLYSCEAARPSSGYAESAAPSESESAKSLAGALALALHRAGYSDVKVSGQRGISYAFKGIGTRTTKGSEDEGDAAMNEVYLKLWETELGKKFMAEKPDPYAKFKTAAQVLEDKGHKLQRQPVVWWRAKQIAKHMKPFWAAAKKIFEEAVPGGELESPGQGAFKHFVIAGKGPDPVVKALRTSGM